MGYIGYIITGVISFISGTLVTQLVLHLIKMNRENSLDE